MTNSEFFVLTTCHDRSLLRFGANGSDEGYAVIETRTGEVKQWLFSRSAARGWLRLCGQLTAQEADERLLSGQLWAHRRYTLAAPQPSAARSC